MSVVNSLNRHLIGSFIKQGASISVGKLVTHGCVTYPNSTMETAMNGYLPLVNDYCKPEEK